MQGARLFVLLAPLAGCGLAYKASLQGEQYVVYCDEGGEYLQSVQGEIDEIYALYRQVHARYHQLCPTCGDRSEAARSRTANLTGRRALVTGGRIKIGHAAALGAADLDKVKPEATLATAEIPLVRAAIEGLPGEAAATAAATSW